MILTKNGRVTLWKKLLETTSIKGAKTRVGVKLVTMTSLLLHQMTSLLLNGWGGDLSPKGDKSTPR